MSIGVMIIIILLWAIFKQISYDPEAERNARAARNFAIFAAVAEQTHAEIEAKRAATKQQQDRPS